MDDLLDLLRQTVRLARERHVLAVVWAGDIFHSKAPSRVSHRLVQQLIDVIRSYPCRVYIVPGNHDIRNDRLDSIHETQPLGVLFRAGALRLEGWAVPDGVHQAPFPLFGVPWLQGHGEFDQADQCPPVEQELAGMLIDYQDVRKAGRHYLVATHAPLYPPGRELAYEYFPAVRWAEAMGGEGNVFYGHVHEPHGTWEAGGVVFCNNGALSRGSLHEYNLTRQVGCTLWDDEDGRFEFVPLDARPASEVFRLQEKEQLTDTQGLLDSFLEDISGARLEVLSAETVIAYVKTLGLGQPAEELAEELLAEAAHRRK